MPTNFIFWGVSGGIMASKKTAVELIALQCSECKRKNYTTKKNRRNTQGKLELKKYCPFDRKHTLHIETKVK
jgi:large subunit ribosomal protein L33